MCQPTQGQASEDDFQRELKLPAGCGNSSEDAGSTGERTIGAVDLCLCGRWVGKVGVVGDIKRLELELCPYAFGDGLIFHQSGGPEEEAGADQGVTTTGAEAWTVETIIRAIGHRGGEAKATSVDVVEIVTVGALSIVHDAVRELEGLRAEKAESISPNDGCEGNAAADVEDIVKGPVPKDGSAGAATRHIWQRSDEVGGKDIAEVEVGDGAVQAEIKGRQAGDRVAEAGTGDRRGAIVN